MGGKSGLVTFTFPPCARRRLLDSMTATSPRAQWPQSAIRPPCTREGNSKGNGDSVSRAKYVSQNCLSDVVCSYPSAHHAAATAEGRRKGADLEREEHAELRQPPIPNLKCHNSGSDL